MYVRYQKTATTGLLIGVRFQSGGEIGDFAEQSSKKIDRNQEIASIREALWLKVNLKDLQPTATNSFVTR